MTDSARPIPLAIATGNVIGHAVISGFAEQKRYLTLPYRSVVSCARLTTSPCHLLSYAALFSW